MLGPRTANAVCCDELFGDSGPVLDKIRALLSDPLSSALPEEVAVRLLIEAQSLCAAERNVVEVNNQDGRVLVVGDLHGQFADLLSIMRAEGLPCESKTVVFLGDYVDRGICSTEVVLYLCACKILFPRNVVMLRGNHESQPMCDRDGFTDECLVKYSVEVLEASFELFRALPLACVIAGTKCGNVFCTHGGIGPHVTTIEKINEVYRFVDVPATGIIAELLWSDPMPEISEMGESAYVHAMTADLTDCEDSELTQEAWDCITYTPNTVRQIGWFYGLAAVQSFLKRNDLVCIIRGHQAEFCGYMFHFKSGETKLPRVVTVFSAPANASCQGAFIRIDPERGFQTQQTSFICNQ